MKDYYVSYYLGDMFHIYTEEAENECKAIEKAMGRIPENSKKLFHDFKIERRIDKW